MIDEKKRQEEFPWERTGFYSNFGEILGYYQAISAIENCNKKGSLLDLACGDGFITGILSDYFSQVTAVDASSVHIAKAKARLPKVDFVESLIEDLAIDEKFDCVTMFNLLEHVADPCRVLRKAAGFLNDTGVLIVHVPNSEAVNRKIAVLMGTLLSCDELSPFDIDIAGHRRSYCLSTLEDDVICAGIGPIIKKGGVFYKMLSTPQIDWFLENGLWDSGFGWGRVGGEQKNWRNEFCRACYEFGKERPQDCNIIFMVIAGKGSGE